MRVKKKLLVIGGGTGTFQVLSGLKRQNADVSVVVSMMDSGGSNRVIRDEFGLLPTSDIRQCILALASEDSSRLFRELFTYRYNAGTGISGMTFGNLFMAALTDILGSQKEAIRRTCEILDVQGKVIPVTFDDVHLVARYDNGKQVLGEHYIDEPKGEFKESKIVEIEVFPHAEANKDALSAIKNADFIIIGPGDLYTSIICNLVVGGIRDAIRNTKGKLIYVANLMTREGQTDSFTIKDHIRELERYLGRKIDICIVNRKQKLSKEILERYEEEGAFPVIDDLEKTDGLKIVRRDLLSSKVYKKSKSDTLVRSFVRHDPFKLARAIMSVVYK